MYQVLSVESKYCKYNNQQLAMGIGQLLQKIQAIRSREAWIYIKAIVMAEMESPIQELIESKTLTNKLRKANAKIKTGGRKTTKVGSKSTSKEKKTSQE